jgi:CDP-paratose 2-epimerase
MSPSRNGKAAKKANNASSLRNHGGNVIASKSKTFTAANTRMSPALITGGAGFIGSNLANRLLQSGQPVIIFDNLSRPGVEKNLEWLVRTYGDLVQFELADTRDLAALRQAVRSASSVFHLAAQVAVTTSLEDPVSDFEINARGTLNLLECIRAEQNPPPLIFTSTNKVYGGLEDLKLRQEGSRYSPRDSVFRANGISEQRSLDFHSPYGCSKGAADQYVIDYARTFNLPAVVFRMSCIYGPHQFGTEDQGWIAHFLIRAIEGQTITLYGDGKQVRDVLFVDDLIDAMELARQNITKLSGHAFNLGGGQSNAISLLEVLDLINELHDEVRIEFDEWRHADQRYYVSDIREFHSATGWSPQVDVREGITRLYRWLLETREIEKLTNRNGQGARGKMPPPAYQVASGRS